ncbi:sigma-70 family RNA polymerase sigma factor [Hymenobacter sp. 15J16-1T3B]|uniref:RNA polymerase sigma factor n=1 Tax=Hymenobacter sp. 15J16-1T3B TaxID=2886941 RepID=UPI001D118C87|nr:sigma-70 family RNA polymerase sigma factor [Hymenobacter sp. 15J16-1T3B]MCC3160655.1 sigma-70 family RNA polymerase sigma factor [Hymenobacter sp. 15J16-1T3B]
MTTDLPLPTDRAAQLRAELLADRPGTLTRLYRRTFPMVERHVRRQGGSAQDAQDVFQDALLVLYEKAVAGTLTLTAAPSTLLVAISRNLWRREWQRRQQHPHAELSPAQADALPDPDAPEPEAASVLEQLARLGERCQNILLSFYYHRQPLEQIAAAHRYGSVRSATVQKFKCLERLRAAVRTAWADTADLLTR